MNALRHESVKQGGEVVFDRVRGPADPENLFLDQPGREEAERSAGMLGGTVGARGHDGVGVVNEGWGDAAGGRRGLLERLLESSRSKSHDERSMV
jgi:hypothetical protein